MKSVHAAKAGAARRLNHFNKRPLTLAILPSLIVIAGPADAGTLIAFNFSTLIIEKGRALCATAMTGSAVMSMTTGLMM